MKRLLLSFGIFAILTQFVGCDGSPKPAGGPATPAEVQKNADRKQEELDRKPALPN
jgi:hypothetical protein